jgi:acyl carrier protein
MGLDSVYLVIEVEQAFGVHFNDRDVENIRTVGQFHELLCRNLGAQASDRCLTQAAFYRVRSALIELAGAERAAVRPGADLAMLLPLDKRDAFWDRFAASTGLVLPRLEPVWREPHWRWWPAFAWASFALFLWGAIAAAVTGSTIMLGAGLSLALLCILGTAMMALAPLQALGRDFGTVGGLARCVVEENLDRFTAPVADSDGVLWRRLRGIICDHLGISESEVQRETEFVRDLGF